MRSRFLLGLVLVVLSLPAAAGTLVSRTYDSPVDHVGRPYDVYLPRGYDGVTPRPALLFLHGRGGWKGSFEVQDYFVEADMRGVVLIFWQGRPVPSIEAFSTFYVDTINGYPDESDVLACLDAAVASTAIDPARVGLVGFSQGGKGAFLIGLKNPSRFSAVAVGAPPTDAFEGQAWSPTFPDYASAAGGDYKTGIPEIVALWYAQSPRFLLANARNLPFALFHGGVDNVVPDSTSLFPYRNTHHVADTPGFTDARGSTPTLSELHAADPSGYAFETHYPPFIGHDETGLLDGATLFDFFKAKTRAVRPDRVVGVTYETPFKPFYWASLGRATSPSKTPASFAARTDPATNAISFSTSGTPSLRFDLPGAGLDVTRRFDVVADAAVHAPLRIDGPIASTLAVTRDGSPLRAGVDYTRDGSSVVFGLLDLPQGSRLSFIPTVTAAVMETDLLVPALVEATGQNGARFSTELTLVNLSAGTVSFEALLLDGSTSTTALSVPAFATRTFTSAALFASLGKTGGAAPLRLRASGAAGRVSGTARVFNTATAGTYGLSFPVATAGASILASGDEAYLFGGTVERPSRLNVSVFAPFEAASATVEVRDAIGVLIRTVPVSLAPLQRTQLDDVLSGVPSPARLSVRVETGRVQVYGTVVSNESTNDPFRSPPLLVSGNALSWTVPAVAAAPGRNGSVFSSDLFLASVTQVRDLVIDVEVTYRPRGGGPPLIAPITILPGSVRVIPDVVRTLFPQAVPSAGALEVRSIFGLEVFAVTRSDPPTGPSSQDFPCVPFGKEITPAAPAVFSGLGESAAARSNLVLVNRGPATNVTLWLLTENGSRGTVTVPLGEGEVSQIDSVARLFGTTGVETTGAALVVAPAASGVVVASVARIDNASNDPAGLAPVPMPGLTLP
ncbi:MAG TPA: PHB depolymerase family esterase [Thermoanaerobaculia bacterium]|nr:PHB depolymerase family esterase [Thermoanaerobaculia bacterium]